MLEAKFGDKYIIWNLFVKIRYCYDKSSKKTPNWSREKEIKSKIDNEGRKWDITAIATLHHFPFKCFSLMWYLKIEVIL